MQFRRQQPWKANASKLKYALIKSSAYFRTCNRRSVHRRKVEQIKISNQEMLGKWKLAPDSIKMLSSSKCRAYATDPIYGYHRTCLVKIVRNWSSLSLSLRSKSSTRNGTSFWCSGKFKRKLIDEEGDHWMPLKYCFYIWIIQTCINCQISDSK